MALKKNITKEDFDKLSDIMKAEYKQDGDNYTLDVEGEEDTGALKRAKEHEKAARLQAEKEAKEAKDALIEAKRSGAASAGDIEALENSWREKLKTAEDALKSENAGLVRTVNKLLVVDAARKIAGEISTAPALMQPVIESRLKVERNGDSAIVRVLDGEGKPSALTLAELATELKADKQYSAIIIGSKASGGGAANAGGSGGGAPSDKSFEQMNGAERTELYHSDRQRFDREAAALKAKRSNRFTT